MKLEFFQRKFWTASRQVSYNQHIEALVALLLYRCSHLGTRSLRVPDFRWMFVKWTAGCSDYLSFHCKIKGCQHVRHHMLGKQAVCSHISLNCEIEIVTFQRRSCPFICWGLLWISMVTFFLILWCLVIYLWISLLHFRRPLHNGIWLSMPLPSDQRASLPCRIWEPSFLELCSLDGAASVVFVQ